MKGVIAVCMSLTPELLKMERAKLIDDALTYDEDVSCLSGKILAQFLRDHNIKAGGCIIGEPTDVDFVMGHKGIKTNEIYVRGKAMRSPLLPYACNTIEHGTSIVRFLCDIGRGFCEKGLFNKHHYTPYTTLCFSTIRNGISVNTVPADYRVTFEPCYVPNHSGGWDPKARRGLCCCDNSKDEVRG
ncbi:acetylornithine deacetylase-like [Trypanosoma rangeli]|uniref:Acetylornithine deacetylase-like n=1 Tax=Trypanosoma rangeli TaxID=5698 RepID=A0A3R7MJC5_TRYRA|nr:acetylornithine deacetylase-like [Trypanosoma rangeli]RNF03535.1 acetylornithine deacetylase-like [Trypanosoma rangeli]|eukprot:RNF03535.1 acetylornithine deacetylase-like [Trypanosoma rangeli]